jgi:uncharacterized FlgJ-related protein
MASSGHSRITLPGLALLVLLVALFFTLLKIKNRLLKMNTINELYKDVYSLLIEAGFKYQQAQIILAQTAHETANFTSDIFLENHNLFGMKNAGQKLVIGTNRGHAVYESITDSIKDFALYYKRHQYLSVYETAYDYVKALKENGYFEADIANYVRGVEHFLKLYFKNE